MKNLLDFDLVTLKDYCQSLGEKSFRAIQLFRWIHKQGIKDFDQMSDLAKSFRVKIKNQAQIKILPINFQHNSKDGTIKWLFNVGEENAIETVFIPETDRGTLCISSQVGCAMSCRFCSTGHQGFSRNLTIAEIIGQLWQAEHFLRKKNKTSERVISNVVMMGMGEPLQNYSAVFPALKIMLDDHAYGLSRRKVTVSTSGIVPMIYKLAKNCPVSLAVSLHASNDKLRDHLVPLNKKYNLDELLTACVDYLAFAPRDFITFEYCMINKINDQIENAKELILLLKKYNSDLSWCKFNLIPFNDFPKADLRTSNNLAIKNFANILNYSGITTTIRKTRGDDINAACGQLAGEVKDRTFVLKRIEKQRSEKLKYFKGLIIN